MEGTMYETDAIFLVISLTASSRWSVTQFLDINNQVEVFDEQILNLHKINYRKSLTRIIEVI